MISVGVVGATGYAGAELVRLLSGHPNVEIAILTSRQYAGARFSDVYPSMAGIVDLVCEAYDAAVLAQRVDLVFTALPHQLPMNLIPELIENGLRVVDLSADFRFRDVSRYEAAYQPHSAGPYTEKAVYGLSEIYTDDIRRSDLIGNPGCYPTSVLLPLIPLIRRNWLDLDSIAADAKSGVSGAGRSPSLTTHFCEVQESFKAYKIGAHRHTPEMEEVLEKEAGVPVQISFVPHLVPKSRGMLTTLYARLLEEQSDEAVSACLQQFYKDAPFVRIRTAARPPDTLHVRGTNYCDIGCKVERGGRRLILISAIDNLVKGAAGQAVQNMNIMLGFDQRAGLDQVPYPI
ncbi:N-acetyl-gamma-glutamyl-phosphate reductase (EC [Olavius algarvensis associated proteobacterium Delta 3]|nr:N-acetyl-gamma-glutamyl-phosphate reductase (EC [Olavius algarvensis associated proteobacterium Delta 3]CAB5140603.1 N-acetyl-gamma-glutamyl-phosphate reductase (EC [Olavius algarvensis associated proteobacterium Delta 3]